MIYRKEVLTSINALLATLLLTLPTLVSAGGQTIRLAGDSNSRLEVKEAIVAGDLTTVLFWTWPDRGDPGFREECSKNYYTVTLSRGLPSADPQPLAQGACAGISQLQGGLLSDGSGKFIVRDRLERWQDGKRLSAEALADLEHIGSLQLNAADAGSQFIDFSPAGDLVMAVVVSGAAAQQWSGVAVVIAAVDPQGRKRWLHKVEKTDSTTIPEQIWAGAGGSALLRYSVIDMTGLGADSRAALLHVSADGKRTELPLVIVAEPYDLMSMKPGSEEDLQKAFAHMDENRSEGLEALAARARNEGGFDVLFERDSDTPERNGYFLLRVGPDGAVQSEQGLGTLLDDYGLQQWKDFYVVGNELVVLSNVLATQSGVNSRRKQWPQTALSRIDLDSLQVETRLVPLERQYLEAAMNAGDEGQQYLEGQPGGTPVLLTAVGDTPVSLETGWVEKRGTLRIYEMTDDLVAFTEYRDRQLEKVAKEEQKRQRKAARQASQEQMSQDMEAALGVSAEEFDALSQEEQMMLMMQSGNMEAMMNSVMKQAQAAQQGSGMTPEQAAQMEASMAQVQQMMQGGGMGAAGMAAPPAQVSQDAGKAAAFTVDALMRGHVRFTGGGVKPVTLMLVDRQGGKELMQKTYPDGAIDEYLSLGRYQLPPDRFGARVTGPAGEVLADLSPGSQ
jgi:hypothetical protein